VSVINTGTDSVIDTINVGEAVGIAISRDGSHLYVSHYKGSNTVSVIDPTTDTVVDTVSVGNVPEYLAIAGPTPTTFTDNFSPPFPQWSNSVGNWTATDGKYFAQAPSNSPETISDLPYVFTNSNLSVTVTVNDVSDGGIRLDSDGTQNNGVVFVLGGNGYGGGNRSGGAGNSAYWAVWHNGVSQQLLGEVDGVFTPGGTYTVTVLVNGNTYKAYMDPDGVFDANSTLITTLVDNTFSSGKVGLYDFYSGLSFSNFSVSGFLAPGSSPLVTEALKNDTGSSPSDRNTKDPTLSGSGDVNAVVSFTVDGKQIATTVTADTNGNWVFAPTGLAEGQHTVMPAKPMLPATLARRR
jgi:YVTN family beta-propeller protein